MQEKRQILSRENGAFLFLSVIVLQSAAQNSSPGIAKRILWQKEKSRNEKRN